MSRYSSFLNTEISEANTASVENDSAVSFTGGGGGTNITQGSKNNMTLSGTLTVTHPADAAASRIVQVSELKAAVGSTTNTDLDFDLADAGQFIQSTTSGIEFDGTAKLHDYGPGIYTNTLDYAKSGNVNITDHGLTTVWTANAEASLSREGASSGKWYWEVTVTDNSNTAVCIGIARAPLTYTNYIHNVTGTLVYTAGGAILRAGSTLDSGKATYTGGSAFVIGIGLDMDTQYVTFWNNGVLQGTYDLSSMGLTGDVYAAVGMGSADYPNVLQTMNFGATPFTYTVPEGYTAGLGTKSESYLGTVNYDITKMEYVSQTRIAQTISHDDFCFSVSGTKLYVADKNTDYIYQYSLGRAWDISTAEYDNKSLPVVNCQGIVISSDGTKVLMVRANYTPYRLYEYTLTTPWDISTGSIGSYYALNIEGGEANAFMLTIDPTETKVYTMSTADIISQYEFGTPFDISTIYYVGKSASFTSVDASCFCVAITSDGSTAFIGGAGNDSLYQLELTTPWDITTAQYVNKKIGILSDIAIVASLALHPEDTYIYIGDSGTNDHISMYAMPTSTSNYITTSDNNQINLSNITQLNTCSIDYTSPERTEMKCLLSFDGRSTWKTYTGQAEHMLAPGDEGTYDTTYINTEQILDDDGIYKMWYSGYDGSKWSVMYADSVDGYNWYNHQVILPAGTYNYYGASVLKVDDVYKMWNYRSNNLIYYHTSTDGFDWSSGTIAINRSVIGTEDGAWVENPCIIKDGAIYKAWYTAAETTTYTRRIAYATSSDGSSWSNHQIVMNPGAEGTYDTDLLLHPHVIKDGSTYRMWYSGYDGSTVNIIYCTSSDGINWSGHTLALAANTEGTYDIDQANSPKVVKDSTTGVYKMWYTGAAGASRDGLYIESYDPANWGTLSGTDTALSGIANYGCPPFVIEAALTNVTVTDESAIDLAFNLNTISTLSSPYVDQVTLNYDENGSYRVANIDNYQVDYLSSTQTKITKLSEGSENIKTNVLI